MSYCLEDGTQCLQGELVIDDWWLVSASAQFRGRSRVSYCLEDGTQCLQGELMIGGWWLVIGDLQTLSPSDSTPNLGEQFMGYCTCPLV